MILDEEPLSSPATLAELTAFEEEAISDHRSEDDGAEGWVSLGRPQLGMIRIPERERVASLPDAKSWALFWVRWPYTIHPSTASRRYEKVAISFELGLSDASALALCPTEVNSADEVSRTFGLTPDLTFTEVDPRVGTDTFTHQVTFTRLTPVITALGVGERRFSWLYTAAAGRPVRAGTKHSIAVLQVPADTRSLDVHVELEIVLRRMWLGRWRPRTARSRRFDTSLDLSTAT